ncbi:hypothetical protein BD410DRAFT_313705 [Rickenella mellea]|uniref:F-box domain-containing protein n=1 Tax=Rickenella mellea TaxID=50990 RepID=A0A4Y7Q1A9_9AGAM|nr:hypothetical protein BD410DRAFT_313705 [Rickenella mellea]
MLSQNTVRDGAVFDVSLTMKSGMRRSKDCEYSHLHLPKLSTFMYNNRMIVHPQPSDSFYTSWLMPSLMRYSGVRTPPPHGISRTSKAMDLAFYASGDFSVEGLRFALHEATELESLVIKFRDSSPTLAASGHRPVVTDLCLSKLRYFSLGFTGMEFHVAETFHDVFRSFTAPIATTLMLHNSCYGPVDETLLAIILDDQAFPSVNKFEFSTRGGRAFKVDTLPIVFARMPSLQHISVCAESYGCEVRRLFDKHQTFPQLLSLRLDHCDDLSDAAMREVLTALRCGSFWAEFQSLKLNHCAGLSKRYLERLKQSMGDKLEYSLAHRSRFRSPNGSDIT